MLIGGEVVLNGYHSFKETYICRSLSSAVQNLKTITLYQWCMCETKLSQRNYLYNPMLLSTIILCCRQWWWPSGRSRSNRKNNYNSSVSCTLIIRINSQQSGRNENANNSNCEVQTSHAIPISSMLLGRSLTIPSTMTLESLQSPRSSKPNSKIPQLPLPPLSYSPIIPLIHHMWRQWPRDLLWLTWSELWVTWMTKPKSVTSEWLLLQNQTCYCILQQQILYYYHVRLIVYPNKKK